MVIPTLGELVPVALAVGLSPVPIIAVVIVVGSPQAKRSGPAFALGWVLGLVAITTAGVLLLGGGDGTAHDEAGIDWGNVLVGSLLLVLAAKQWRGRPPAGVAATMPGWMATLGTASSGRAALFGAALAGANPKNLAMGFAAASTIAEAGLDQGATLLTVAGFVALGSLTVLGAVATAFAGGKRGAAGLARLRVFMADNNAVIMFVVLLLLGGKLLGDGLGDFFA